LHNTPVRLDLIAKHKKVACYQGGLKNALVPLYIQSLAYSYRLEFNFEKNQLLDVTFIKPISKIFEKTKKTH
jgi:hypothetical protein